MTSIVPGFEYDVFISYRHKDNKYDGWVTEFVENLKNEIEATFKEEVNIYFDINPHDGLLESHNVDESLRKKLKSLVFIPIISQTYCDTNSFAWKYELLEFLKISENDQFGKSVSLKNGNVSNRILPVKIHEIDQEDEDLFLETTGLVLRTIDFIYKKPGVNRPLRAIDDSSSDQNPIIYRDQINKTANAIKDIIYGLKNINSDKPFTKKEKTDKPKNEPEKSESKSKGLESTEKRAKNKNYKAWIGLIVSLIVLVIIGALYVPKWFKKQEVINEILPKINKLKSENFYAPIEAFKLAMEAKKYIPEDTSLINLIEEISSPVNLKTEPSGVEVYWKDYNKPDGEWNFVGKTPLTDVLFPEEYLRIQLKKEGYITQELALPNAFMGEVGKFLKFVKMYKEEDSLRNMVYVPSGTTYMLIVGMEQTGPRDVPEFYMDKYEVTNKEYKIFVENEMYNDKSLWKKVFSKTEFSDAKIDSLLKTFTDQTGRPGPSTWVAGTFKEGTENHPVSGLSWFEAAAYAQYNGKELPSVFHWGRVAQTGRSEFILPFSNFNGTETAPVGRLDGLQSYGLYDLAGNVREWCNNSANNPEQRYILGGGFNDPVYGFNDAYTQNALNRTLTNGFRCIKMIPNDTVESLNEPVFMAFRDYKKENPVDDQTFELIKRQYAYDKTELNAKKVEVISNEYYKLEKITLDAAYNNERFDVYLYLPISSSPPYQTILFYGGSGAIHRDKFNYERTRSFDFLLKNNRAVVVPILKGTYDREDELDSDLQDETVFYKDHVIMWRKDVGRSLDYLETRDDLDLDNLGYFGWSWGGFMGGIMPALEKRIKAVVLNVGGMEMTRALPEADQINFLPRVTQPVIMLNGKFDMFFPYETSQLPMYNFLGTPEKDKEMKVYETGHLVPKKELIRETLNWFDQYLGTVK